MATSGPMDQDPAKKEVGTNNDRLEMMRARLAALPSQIALHPDDLKTYLEQLERSLDLEQLAQRILKAGYQIRR